jgi:MSHA biogenesis protein MshL
MRWLRGPLALTACIAGVSSGAAQSSQSSSAPPPLPVVRLDGGALSTSAPSIAQSNSPAVPASFPVTQLDDAPRTALDGTPSVSLSIARPMPLGETLSLLVSGTPLSLVLAEDVSGSFVGELKGMTMRQALEAVLFPRSLDYDVQGTLIRVFTRRPATRLFDINHVNVVRSWERGVRSAVAIPGTPASVDAASRVESNAVAELERGVAALLSSSGRMHIDRGAGLVQVTDFADRLDQIGIYLEAVQLRASRQVRIEARVIEITLKDPASASVDWRAASAAAGGAIQVDPGAAGIRVTDFAALMRALGEQGTVRAIASPRIVAMNNEPAVMRVGSQQVYFQAASAIDGSGRTGERTFTPATVLSGLTLTVTAQIAADGIVQLHVAPTYAAAGGTVKSPRGESVPTLSVAEADTTVRVRNGDTVVIAGMLHDRERVTQGTGMAGFFGAQTRDTVAAELVILLTPTVVTSGAAGSR